jgi:hypothetical protein
MTKEFVPYELAVKLKKLGFNEPCFFAFDNCSTPMRCSDLRTNEQKFNGVNYNSSSYTSQPTFSQAFRWFREKYELYSTIMFRVSMEDNNEYWDWLIKGEEVVYRHFKTYEEAELACLTKLIEIVEQQKQK